MALRFRKARPDDLDALVALLAQDAHGPGREDATRPLDPAYRAAFAAIYANGDQTLLVAESDGVVVGTLLITFLRGLSRRGAWRGLIEAVRVREDRRGAGVGAAMMDEALARCRARGCVSVMLTSDKARGDAHRFYARLGFEATHEGFKMTL
jgi:GNAT superfamily N-acetyltransferase